MGLESKHYLISLCLLFQLTSYLSDAKVIMFFPVPGTSHIRYHTNVARAMREFGHETWVCIPEHTRDNGKIDTSGINVLYYGKKLGDLEETLIEKSRIHDIFWENKTQSIFDFLNIMRHFDDLCVSILKDGLIEEVRKINPALFVLDSLPFVRGIYALPYKLDIPYAVVGSMHDMITYRIPFSPAATPLQVGDFGNKMNFQERLQNLMFCFMMSIRPYLIDSDVVSIFAPEKPHKTIDELIAEAEVFITELDPIMDYARPMIPNTKMIGGIAAKDVKALKEPFKSFVDNSKKGVIVISFGSSIVKLPSYVYDKIHRAAKTSGLNIVWRSDRMSSDPDRILTSKWIPQNDILGHPNTKLFIAHCGKNGQYEALYHGVPLLCLPIFGDQPYNAERARAKGYGLRADVRYTTTEELSELVQEIISNSTYKNKISNASKLFRLLYKSPMKEAAYWLDHVTEYGGEYMRSASQTMPVYQFYMLDVLAVLLIVAIIMMFTMYIILRSCFRLCCGSKRVKAKSE